MIALACVLAMISGGVQAQHSRAQGPAPRKKHALTKRKHHALAKKNSSAKRNSPVKATAPVKAAAPVAPVPAQVTPPVPATLMNRSPVNPSVTLKDGLLTIDAPNSMLSEVLNGVRNATGAVVEGATPDERVAVRLGPGNPRQVIAALLQGTPYDFVILGSQESQDAITRIVLTQPSEASSAKEAPGAGNPAPMVQQPPVNNAPDRAQADDAATPPAGDIQTEQAEQPPQAPQVPQSVQGQVQPTAREQPNQNLQQTNQPKQ
jgi:hypothetical protein